MEAHTTTIMEAHTTSITTLSSQIKTFHASHLPFRIYHGTTNTTRKSQLTTSNTIDIRSLNRILSISPTTKTALVEPNVPMDRLVAATLAYGLVPPVVHDFPGVTCGGGFSGGSSGHSTAFRYGYFEDTVVAIEVVLGDGEVVRAEREGERRDLFYAAASGFGTIGVVTMLEIVLVEATEYVALTYLPVAGFEEATRVLRELSMDQKVDSLDAIMYSRTSGVVMVGRGMSQGEKERQNLPVQSFSGPSDPWFYLHAESQLGSKKEKKRNKNKTSPYTEAIPITDFFFRYNRGSYWMGRGVFMYFLIPFNRVTRRVFDSLMDARAGYHRFHISGFTDHTIIQDLAVPYEAVPEFSRFLEDEVRWYPLWLAPLMIKHNKGEIARASVHSVQGQGRKASDVHQERLFLNIGVWGPGYRRISDTTELNRDLEAKTHELGGLKLPYGYIYGEEEEFWRVYYDKGRYEAARKKYGAEYLPSVFEKVRYRPEVPDRSLRGRVKKVVWGIWPLGGLYAVAHAVFCKEYLMKRSEG